MKIETKAIIVLTVAFILLVLIWFVHWEDINYKYIKQQCKQMPIWTEDNYNCYSDAINTKQYWKNNIYKNFDQWFDFYKSNNWDVLLQKKNSKWTLKNILNIPKWKIKIYKDNKIAFYTFIKLASINTQECGSVYGFCKWPTNDWWPFQFTYDISKWKGFFNTRDHIWLFESQLNAMIERFNSKRANNLCWKIKRDDNRAYCLFKFHNWRNKQWAYYASEVMKIRQIYINIYKEIYNLKK